jgi:hypothetical protein
MMPAVCGAGTGWVRVSSLEEREPEQETAEDRQTRFDVACIVERFAEGRLYAMARLYALDPVDADTRAAFIVARADYKRAVEHRVATQRADGS